MGPVARLLVEETGAFEAPSLRYAGPGLVLASGGLLAIDPLLHGSAGPTNDGAETRQHLILGGLLLFIGSLDLAYEARWLDHWTWGLALPAGMLAASTSFLFHAQHGDPSQHELLGAQHRILGATLAVAAIAKGLSVSRPRRPQTARFASHAGPSFARSGQDAGHQPLQRGHPHDRELDHGGRKERLTCSLVKAHQAFTLPASLAYPHRERRSRT